MLHIAISPCFMPPEPSRIVFGRKWLTYVENEMVRYVSGPGILPCLIPQVDNLDEILQPMAGLVLQGGTDVSPKTYGHPHLNEKQWPGDELRDVYELKVLDHFVKQGKPVFGICRGCQLLNVYFGGTLIQDIFTEHPDPLTHRCADEYDKVRHAVEFSGGGILEGIYNTPGGVVNSIHHQGVDKLGEGVVVEAVCPDDGMVEAISHGRNILGVQWHPEFGGDIIDPEKLIEYFKELCRQRG